MYTYSITTPSPGSVWVTPAGTALVEERHKTFCNAVVRQVPRMVELQRFLLFFVLVVLFHVAYL